MSTGIAPAFAPPAPTRPCQSIALANGRGETLVDAEDYPALSQHRWQLQNGYAFRAFRTNGQKDGLYLHRALLRPPSGLTVDHVNRDKLDNRRANLRLATRSQQRQNALRTLNKSTLFK